MKRAVVALLLLTVVGCGTSDEDRSRIKACIAEGGQPQYTSNRDGVVTEWFGCVFP
jgi:hypothetical protein